MDQLANLIDGFGQILTLQNLLWVTIGAFRRRAPPLRGAALLKERD